MLNAHAHGWIKDKNGYMSSHEFGHDGYPKVLQSEVNDLGFIVRTCKWTHVSQRFPRNIRSANSNFQQIGTSTAKQ